MGKRVLTVEARGLMPISAGGKVHAPPATLTLLKRVAELKAPDDAYSVGWDEREQRDESSVSERLATLRYRSARKVRECLDGLNPSKLDLLPHVQKPPMRVGSYIACWVAACPQ